MVHVYCRYNIAFSRNLRTRVKGPLHMCTTHSGISIIAKFLLRVCCEFRTQTMIFDRKRFDGVMRQIFGENGSFLARSY